MSQITSIRVKIYYSKPIMLLKLRMYGNSRPRIRFLNRKSIEVLLNSHPFKLIFLSIAPIGLIFWSVKTISKRLFLRKNRLDFQSLEFRE